MTGTMWQARVECLSKRQSIYSKSWVARFISVVIVVHLWWCLIALWNGPINGLAPGMSCVACCNLPRKVSISGILAARLRCSGLRSSRSVSIFLVGREMQHMMPSNSRPRISF